jgi:hypothetical protein
MKQKILLPSLILTAIAFIFSCKSSSDYNSKESNDTAAYIPPPPDTSLEAKMATSSVSTPAVNSADPNAGIGKFQHVDLTHPLDKKMVDEGKALYDLKCSSCHKLTDEKLVGPGWKGVTDRRTPEWIMNFVTNTDEMLNKDEAAKGMLEVCLVRMPNQSLSDNDARNILEFQRNNDGKK